MMMLSINRNTKYNLDCIELRGVRDIYVSIIIRHCQSIRALAFSFDG
jgi:hypothetical protein